ncbi:hypothetical protein CVT24_001024 [Panaeolus cyanescens]|uniref:Uncharacterized protein n=1 Tax=Panaeolus cyanescens TaxID=181874 RepID=A0A409WBM2_9AGAR|nr:hypothetical protein CVT24_001024 [Panaeolus cyanescens]
MYIHFQHSPHSLSLSESQRPYRRRVRERRNKQDSTDDGPDSDSNTNIGRRRRKSTNIPYANTEGFRVTTYTNQRSSIPDASVIPAGQPFAGRMSGGSGRSEIFGTRTYGSGYPNGGSTRGTSGRDLPFFFWPIAWPALKTGPGFDYLHANGEYGDPTNSTRLGGPQMVATFTLFNTTLPSAITFRVLSDNVTVLALTDFINANCSLSSVTPDFITEPISPFLTTSDSRPAPETVVQYYRASSIALALDMYNNTAIHSPVDGVFDAPLPELDERASDMLSCLNLTIGRAAPLVTSVRTSKPDSEEEAKGSPATTVVAVICSLFGFCILAGVLMRYISIRRRRANANALAARY